MNPKTWDYLVKLQNKIWNDMCIGFSNDPSPLQVTYKEGKIFLHGEWYEVGKRTTPPGEEWYEAYLRHAQTASTNYSINDFKAGFEAGFEAGRKK